MPSSQLSSPLPENEEFLGMQRRQYLLDSALEALSSETMGLESNSNQTSLHYMSNNVTYAFMPSDSSENNTAHPMSVLITFNNSVQHNLKNFICKGWMILWGHIYPLSHLVML